MKDIELRLELQRELGRQYKEELKHLVKKFQDKGLDSEGLVDILYSYADEEYGNYYQMRDWL